MFHCSRQFAPSAFFTTTLVALWAASASAQTQTEIVEENGIRYRVTRQEIQRPISKTEWQDHEQTVFRERYDTQWHTNYRNYITPVTEYRQELFLANRWNPFGTPYWSYRYVPVVRWESRYEPYQVPIAQRTLVPEQQTVRIPHTTTHIAKDEIVSRVAIGVSGNPSSDPFASPSAVARRDGVGGKKLDGDPPKEGIGWKSSNEPAVRR
jgi:hypothetical protein